MIAAMVTSRRADMFIDLADDPREDGPTLGDERTTLVESLRRQRLTLEMKCSGLDAEAMARRSVEPSTMSLLGLVRHLAEVERGWFRGFAQEQTVPRYYSKAEPDGDFDNAHGDEDCVRDAFTYWHAEIEHAREIVSAAELDATLVIARKDETYSLRWILVHLIEEYARHCGHADLLRETIDGVTGD